MALPLEIISRVHESLSLLNPRKLSPRDREIYRCLSWEWANMLNGNPYGKLEVPHINPLELNARRSNLELESIIAQDSDSFFLNYSREAPFRLLGELIRIHRHLPRNWFRQKIEISYWARIFEQCRYHAFFLDPYDDITEHLMPLLESIHLRGFAVWRKGSELSTDMAEYLCKYHEWFFDLHAFCRDLSDLLLHPGHLYTLAASTKFSLIQQISLAAL